MASNGGKDIHIRPLQDKDHEAWVRMWRAYCEFYQTSLSPEYDQALWRRLHESKSDIRGKIALVEGEYAGFLHYLLHPHTWSLQNLCYLEDLYVDPSFRRGNVGYSLIQSLVEQGKQDGWRRVYWHTQTDNVAARRLYERFVPPDPFVRYTIPL